MTATATNVGADMARINEIDRRILATMTGRDRIKALLDEKGLNLKEFAEKVNEWVENVSRCISGERPLPEVRDKLAEELELTREQVDSLIDGTA
jgi:predicted DNA-binding transcriptional regulator